MTNVNTGRVAVDSDRPDLSNGEALTGLYDAHARDLHRYLARRLDPATADDLVAETFLVAWERRARYEPSRGSPRAWLFGIATNLLRRHARTEAATLRAMTRDAGHAVRAEPEDAASAARVDAGRAARALSTGLAALRPEERDVLLLVACRRRWRTPSAKSRPADGRGSHASGACGPLPSAVSRSEWPAGRRATRSWPSTGRGSP